MPDTDHGDTRPGDEPHPQSGVADGFTLLIDRTGTVQFASGTVSEFLGHEHVTLIGEEWTAYLHRAARESFADAIETVRAGGTDTLAVETRFLTSDGSSALATARLEDFSTVQPGSVLVSVDPDTGPTPETITDQRRKLALEGANLGVWDWDMVTGEVTRDELLAEMLGYTPAEMGDRLEDWERLVHPEGKQRHDAALAEHVEANTPYYECEYRMQTDSGTWKWVRTIGKVVERDGDGTPLRAVGIHQDIDDRKRAELALEEERDLFQQGPAIVFQWRDEPGWPIEYVSENVEEILGYDPDTLESEARAFADLVHEADLPELEHEMATQPAAGYRNSGAYRVKTADGECRWVIEFTKTLRADDTARLLGYLVDITERKVGEQKYQSLFENSRDALMVFDRDGYLDYNQRTLELFGYESGAAFLESTPWDRSPPTQPDGRDSKEKALEHIEAAFETGEAFFEWTHQRQDGTTFPSEVKLSRFEHEGEPALHALVRDISDRKAHERRLREQRDGLEILNQVVRHDIRNDLNVITGYVELLADHVDPDGQEHVQTALDNADHAIELTETAREMAEAMLTADRELRDVELHAVLESELRELRTAYPGAVITSSVHSPVGAVVADDMLKSVFRNLLKNAVQHNDAEIPVVSVSATPCEDTVQVCVADNGPGIPDSRKDTVFGKGEKGLDSPGTGTGLYLVETLVESYGGDVWIEDNEPDGSAFFVELDRAGSPIDTP